MLGHMNVKFRTDVSGQPIGPFFKGQKIREASFYSRIFLPLKKGPRDCPKTPVRNYHYSLRNNPEEYRYQIAVSEQFRQITHQEREKGEKNFQIRRVQES
jgi:hypothetical protein